MSHLHCHINSTERDFKLAVETLREAFESASASQNEPEQPVSASLQDAAATPAKQSAQAPASKRRLAGKLSTGSDASSSDDGERGSAFANPPLYWCMFCFIFSLSLDVAQQIYTIYAAAKSSVSAAAAEPARSHFFQSNCSKHFSILTYLCKSNIPAIG